MNDRLALEHRTVIDTLWLILSAGLVLLMQPGFMCLESGLTRSKNSINVAAKNIADFGISLALYWSLGYGLMFGITAGGWIGLSDFWVDPGGNFNLAAFFVFQAMFCGTATTIISGAIAERVKFTSYIIISGLSSGLIYPVIGHWAWNGLNQGEPTGWLGVIGFTDFAGSTVVHSVGGWIALATLLIIGPRTGRFSNRGSYHFQGSNLPLSTMGTLLLWVGWIGFNGGSNLAFNEEVPLIIVNTMMAGIAGMLGAATLSFLFKRVIEIETLLNGSLAGLVAITAGCHAVSTPVAVVIGLVGGWVMWQGTLLLEARQIDDAVGAVPVHLFSGIWGTLAVGLFGWPDSSVSELITHSLIQLLGVGMTGLWAFGLTYLLLRLINPKHPIRVTVEEEEQGLNIVEHQAKTEAYDLMTVMMAQAKSQNLSLRAPVDPFTELGPIAHRYNQVMDSLEEAVARTEAIVQSATDAILTFRPYDLQVLSANASAQEVFGYAPMELLELSLHHLLVPLPEIALETLIGRCGIHEVIGRRADTSQVPLEASIAEATLGTRTFYTGIFRDISARKANQERLAQAHEEILALNQQLKAENLKLGAELEITRKIQRLILPTDHELKQIQTLEVAGFMEPVETVGGDYYDVLQQGNRLKIGIGDVTGHGLHSCLLMLMVQTAVRTLLVSEESDPKRFLAILNRVIHDNIQRMQADRSLTLSFVDYQDGQLRLSGQHEEMIVVRQGGTIERIDTLDLGFPIGLEEDITAFVGQTEVQLTSGDVVVLYTDGITEAENETGHLYGLDRLCQVVSQHRARSPWEIQSVVIEDVKHHIGSQHVYDDITLLVLKQK